MSKKVQRQKFQITTPVVPEVEFHLRPGFKEAMESLGKLTGPFYTPLARKEGGILKLQYHVSAHKQPRRIVYYRVHLNVEAKGTTHVGIIAFDPADGGPHCDERKIDGSTRKNFLPFNFDPNDGYYAAWADANTKIALKGREFRDNYLQGRWPENAYGKAP